ncbi:PKD domain-containing protein [Algibacillus agarilyticus]|uniref:PKD domain-containing protein n=1 Tax=Algibacillus agarilyticus TaxID=2234133 RepID=UPI0018E58E66|nr:PKD domain-containing protein [Algibacillus agarilyticus]
MFYLLNLDLRPSFYSVFVSLIIRIAVLASVLTACGSGGETDLNIPPKQDDTTVNYVPINTLTQLNFRDQHAEQAMLSGTMLFKRSPAVLDQNQATAIWLYWTDEQGDVLAEAWQKIPVQLIEDMYVHSVEIAEVVIPSVAHGLKVYLANDKGRATDGIPIRIDDFVGNVAMSGPGGNELESWYYGVDRPSIFINRSNTGLCSFDNGLVRVIDMANNRDDDWHTRTNNNSPNIINDDLYLPYTFTCSATPVNTFQEISDEVGIWTYSTLNDAMFYGTQVYDMFVKYLGEPPLKTKINLRVHYGSQWRDYAYWDGAYANFSDAYPFQYSMLSLDSVAHEVGHGVLSRISNLNPHVNPLSLDAQTLHEAFSDISGVMAKYEFTGHLDWEHGGESHGQIRQLDSITTETGAIASWLDYADAGTNYYQRIGMITYPFYLLTQQWGIETAYQAYILAAEQCWEADTTLIQAAKCIELQAEAVGGSKTDVINAFKAVKIKLFDQGVLSHFLAQSSDIDLTVVFSDDSRATDEVVDWLWDFGDGQSSTHTNPTHQYSQSGVYRVKLSVKDTVGDEDYFEREIIVNP